MKRHAEWKLQAYIIDIETGDVTPRQAAINAKIADTEAAVAAAAAAVC